MSTRTLILETLKFSDRLRNETTTWAQYRQHTGNSERKAVIFFILTWIHAQLLGLWILLLPVGIVGKRKEIQLILSSTVG